MSRKWALKDKPPLDFLSRRTFYFDKCCWLSRAQLKITEDSLKTRKPYAIASETDDLEVVAGGWP